MKIGIMGLAGAPCREVAEQIASRLGLEVFVPEVGIRESVELLSQKDDFVIYDNYLSDVVTDITFGLYTSLMSDTLSANVTYEKRKEDTVFSKETLLQKDVFMDVSFCSVDFIVSEILRIMTSGVYGMYVPPYLVFPANPNSISWESLWNDRYYDATEALTVYMCGDCYRLTCADTSAYQCIKNETLLHVNIIECDFDVPTIRELNQCKRILGIDFQHALDFYEMLLYSRKFGFDTVDDGYVNAYMNAAKPMERVHALGIAVQ